MNLSSAHAPASFNVKTVLSWCLYDFANSFYVAVIPATIWSVYYARVIVGNAQGLGDLWWGRAVSFSMAFVALTSPLLGGLSDYAGVRKRLLILYTLLAIAATCLLSTVAPGMILLGFLLSMIANIGFEGAQVFYNAYLPEIAPRDHQGRVSGWGFATGYSGSFIGLLIALPFVQRQQYGAAFIAIAACYLVFSLPAFLFLPPDTHPRMSVPQAALGGLRSAVRTFREILRLPEMRRFLFAYLIFEDGVVTVINFSSLFAATTLGFSMTQLIGLFATVQLAALVGAWAWAKPTDKLGPRFVVLVMLAQWSLVVTAVYFVQGQTQFFVLAAIAGTGLGAIQASARAFMSTLVPPGREAEFFGFYALCGKSAAIFGPLVFGTLSQVTGGNQRIAILSVLAFYLIGAVLISGSKAGGPTYLPAPAADEPG